MTTQVLVENPNDEIRNPNTGFYSDFWFRISDFSR